MKLEKITQIGEGIDPRLTIEELKKQCRECKDVDPWFNEIGRIYRPSSFVLWNQKGLDRMLPPCLRLSAFELEQTQKIALLACEFNMVGLLVGVIQQIGGKEYYFDFYHPETETLVKVFDGNLTELGHFLGYPKKEKILALLDGNAFCIKGKKRIVTGGVKHRPLKKLILDVTRSFNTHVIDGNGVWPTKQAADERYNAQLAKLYEEYPQFAKRAREEKQVA